MERMFVADHEIKHFVYSGDRRYYFQFDPRRGCWQYVSLNDEYSMRLLGRWYVKQSKV